MSAFVFVAGCEGTASRFANLDLDLRDNAGGLDTSAAARQATVSRPRPDARGVISYPSYQVAVAERGDTVQSLASRVGVSAPELARFNGLQNSDTLNPGEIVALPRNVQAPSAAGIIQAPIATQPRDITAIATTALDEATPQNTTQQTTSTITRAVPSRRIDGPEPIRHQVKEGETAFSIARLHNVSVRSLNDWNGLGPDLKVRTGQYLLIPVVDQQVPQAAPAPELEPAPGNGTRSVISEPPSGAQPLPAPEPPAQPKPEPEPVRASKLQPPVVGKVIKPYKRGQNEGIDIEAAAGTSVRAAEDGEVAAITRDTDQVPILVLRHADKLLTVYANISDISVKKGDKIKRGQQIAKVGNASPSFLHFEVRQGFESTDPVPFLK
ncbi:MAG: peptidoglycan DD-metalloendopeptidase family protein [Litoreibacter sp.]